MIKMVIRSFGMLGSIVMTLSAFSFPKFFSFESQLMADPLHVETEEVVLEEPEEEEPLTLEEILADHSVRTVDPSEISCFTKAGATALVYGKTPAPSYRENHSTLTTLVLQGQVPDEALGIYRFQYTLTPEDYHYLLYCVEFETRSGCLQHKILITQVVMNRVLDSRFPTTVEAVICAPRQFSVMLNYDKIPHWTPSQVTVDAIAAVFSGDCPDYAQGALYFCNPYIVGEGNWFDRALRPICEIEGHRFYTYR